MPHIFISYQSNDRLYVNSLKDALRSNGYDVWLDASNLPGSPDWEDEIRVAIENAFVLLIVMTPTAEESKWVRREKHYADNLNKPIIPLLREGKMWFSLLDMQFVDARNVTEANPVPSALYAALFRYVPIDETIEAEFQKADPTNRDAVIATIRRLAEQASNPYSPQGYTSRQVLKQFSAHPDARIAKRAQMEIDDLPSLPIEEFKRANIKTEPLKLPPDPAETAASLQKAKEQARANSMGLISRLLALLLLVAVAAIVVLVISLNQSRNDNLSGASMTPARTIIAQEPALTLTITDDGALVAEVTSVVTNTATANPSATPAPSETMPPTTEPTATATLTPTLTPTLVAGTTRTDQVGIAQVWVPAGCFLMGQDVQRDRTGDSDERPSHEVCLTTGFWMDQFEVTNEAFKRFIDDGGYAKQALWSPLGWTWLQEQLKNGPLPNSFNDGNEGFPRANITWYEAEAYAKWRGGQLPTEAQWEWAARGPSARIYPWGNTFEASALNFCDQRCPADEKNAEFDDGVVYTARVKTYEGGRSWVNAYNMAGNVWEWTNDWYSDSYYSVSPKDDPAGPNASITNERVLKGGSWGSLRQAVRSSYRAKSRPNFQGNYYGVRIISLS
jgi:formylglycine-generating enzyme required for sulfatase activity